MGLDIYVGSLTRYYAGDWETIIQQTARQTGMKVEIIRSNPNPPDTITDKAVINQAVHSWMNNISTGLKAHISEEITWDEILDGQYFTDKPDWIGYAGLVLLAAHKEHPQFPLPQKASQHWDQDPAWQASNAEEYKSQFSQILFPEFWLPIDFPFTFNAQDVVGNEVCIGSSVEFLKQLNKLNQETYRASESELEQWKYDGAESQDSYDKTAKFGLAMFLHHAQLSVSHKLPIKLDY